MSKPLILHIGTHKTATTTIQHFFSKNRSLLRNMGLHYPEQGLINMPGHYAHHRIAHAIAERDKLLDFEGAKAFFDVVYEDTADDETVFLSAEPFYRHVYPMGNDDTNGGYRTYIERVREATAKFDVRIMVMLRRQDLFAESLYSEHVLSTNYQKQIADFIIEKRALINFEDRLGDWAAVFGRENILLKPFERESIPKTIERLFIDWLELDWSDEFEDVGNFNQGLNRTFVEYKRRINSKSQPNNINTAFRHWLNRASRRPFAEKFNQRNKYYFSPRDRTELMKSFEEENQRIAETYLGHEELFVRGIDADIQKFHPDESLNTRDFEEITKNILRALASE